MSNTTVAYGIFIIALFISIILDLFIFSKKDNATSIKSALVQYFFWVFIALSYCVFLWFEFDSKTSLEFLSAYFMEMSLSIDNIFVFVMIFSSLQINEKNVGRVLTIGVMLAIVLRILFIAIGIILINKFHFILYIFGALLVFTGFKMFFENQEEENDVKDSRIYKLVRKYLRYTDMEPEGKYIIYKRGKAFFTKLALAIVIIGITDIVFALDSIPAVFAVSTNNLVLFSSNIFAVLGLRALFFILQKAADRFDFLQQGIAVVLVFIGIKMLLEIIDIKISIGISLGAIVLCIGTSILYSLHYNREKTDSNTIT